MDREENRSQKRIIILTVILFLNLILISNSIVLKNERSLLQNALHSLVYPVQTIFSGASEFIADKLNAYVFLKDKHKDLMSLKKKQSVLKYENYLLKRQLKDLEFSRRAAEKFGKLLNADIISIDSGFPFSGAIINRGYFSGIKRNMVVVNSDMDLVGKIAEPVSMFTSKVRFITNPTGGTGAYIEKNMLEGLVRGGNTGLCSFNYLIGNKPVEPGDIVVTSGTDRIFPPYLKIGEVVSVKKKILVQDVMIKPFFTSKPVKKLIILTNNE